MDNETRIQKLEEQVKFLTDIIYKDNFSDNKRFEKKSIFVRDVEFKDGVHITIGTSSGTKFGSSSSKMSFFGAPVVAQQNSISAPSGGATVDSQARTAITSILGVLDNLGLTA